MADMEKGKALREAFKTDFPNMDIEFKYVMHMRYEFRFIERGKILYRLALTPDFVEDNDVETILESLRKRDYKKALESLDAVNNTAYFGKE